MLPNKPRGLNLRIIGATERGIAFDGSAVRELPELLREGVGFAPRHLNSS